MEPSPKLIGSCVISQQVSSSLPKAVPSACQITENYIIIALSDGEIQIFDISGTQKKTLSSSQGTVWALAVQGDMLASGGTDNFVEIWDLATGEHQQTLKGHTSTIRSLVILSDKQRIISGSRDTTIRVWDVAKGNCTDVLSTHTGTVRSISLSNAENLLASGSYDGSACVWRINNDKLECLQKLQGHEGAVYCVKLVGDEDVQVATAGMDASFRIWDPNDGKCLANLQEHSTLVNQLMVVGSQFVTADNSGCICVWSIGDSPKLIHRLKVHSSSLVSLDSDGEKIVSGGAGGLVKLGDLKSGQLLGQLGEEAGAVWNVGFLKDGRMVLVLAREGKVMMEIWHVD
ncbi:WD domain-containing protein [Phlyctema vagabunda]|uniref:Mitochondrial division protein 1 n=1 Tax=Phlyctema vagabunda TaxID=108571 RepID=A0ABR4PGD0_9HELO